MRLTFVLRWLLFSLLALVLSLIVLFPMILASDSSSFGMGYYLLFAGSLAVLGAFISTGQYLALKPHMPVGKKWILAGAAGMGLGVVSEFLPALGLTTPVVMVSAVAVMQAVLLKPHVQKPWLWVVISLIGLLVGVGFQFFTWGPVGLFAGYSVVTGIGIVWLRNQTK